MLLECEGGVFYKIPPFLTLVPREPLSFSYILYWPSISVQWLHKRFKICSAHTVPARGRGYRVELAKEPRTVLTDAPVAIKR